MHFACNALMVLEKLPHKNGAVPPLHTMRHTEHTMPCYAMPCQPSCKSILYEWKTRIGIYVKMANERRDRENEVDTQQIVTPKTDAFSYMAYWKLLNSKQNQNTRI